ncbi:retrovirus-related pol polyprotein from transposon TNT 1-94 [Tanacetum coccineum]
MLNPLALVAQQQPFTHFSTHLLYYTQNSSTRSQQAATRNRGKAIVNSSPPIYDQEPDMVTEDDALSKEKEIDKLMALISLSFKKIYKPTNNNLELHQIPQEMSKTETAKAAAYHKEKMLLCKQEEAGIQLSAEQVDWRDDTNDEPEDQELEAHYLYMAKIQEVTSDAADNSGPILDRTSKQPDLLMTHIQNEQGNPPLSNTPLSFNSFATRRDNSVHRRLWVLKAHDGKSQASKKSTCYIRDLKGNDLLTDSPWFWHRRLSHLNFDTINLLSKYDIVIGLTKLKFIKYYLVLLVSCGKQNLRHSQHQMSRIFYLLLHGTTLVVSESSFVHAVDAPDQRQQHNITLSTSTTVAADTPPLNIQTTPVTTSQAPTQEQLSLLQITLSQTETH